MGSFYSRDKREDNAESQRTRRFAETCLPAGRRNDKEAHFFRSSFEEDIAGRPDRVGTLNARGCAAPTGAGFTSSG
jgi:hypothetical protein